MAEEEHYGIILANTGTPDAPTPEAVKSYLSKFLINRRIAPMNRFIWWFILHGAILPARAKASAEKYSSIWTDEGSPLAITHAGLVRTLQAYYDSCGVHAHVALALSYTKPSMADAIAQCQAAGANKFVVLPLYPQSAYAITGVVLDSYEDAVRKANLQECATFIDNYSVNDTYIRAIAELIRSAGFDASQNSSDRLLFSFHSIPCADARAGDTYETQVNASIRRIADELEIAGDRWQVGYQCRFDAGRDWLAPSSRDVIASWADNPSDLGRVFVVCPGFAVDCLETLYDVNHELRNHYMERLSAAGADISEHEFVYVPCLGNSQAHIKVLTDVLSSYLET